MDLRFEVWSLEGPDRAILRGVERSGKGPRPIRVGMAVTDESMKTFLGAVTAVQAERLPLYYWLYTVEVLLKEGRSVHLGETVLVLGQAPEDESGGS